VGFVGLGLLSLAACSSRTTPAVVPAEVSQQLFSTAVADVTRLGAATNEGRFDALTALLTERKLPFEVEPFTIEPRKGDSRTAGRNIVVTIAGRDPEIVVGAHYDAVRMQDGTFSKGAVDNGASVIVLVRVAEALSKTRPRQRVRIVFFDMEELGLLGSARYARDHRARKTRAMVNLDVNAFGDTVIFGPRGASNGAALEGLRSACMDVVGRCLEFPEMPPSDDQSFQQASVPAVSMAMMSETEAHQLWLYVNARKTSGLQSGFAPQLLRTIHTPADAPSLVEPRALAEAYRTVLALLARLDRS